MEIFHNEIKWKFPALMEVVLHSASIKGGVTQFLNWISESFPALGISLERRARLKAEPISRLI